MPDKEIDFEADFLTFQNQIIEEFGEHYSKQAELFFERSMEQAKQGLEHSAIVYGKFALEQSNYSNDKTGISCLIGYISQLHCDLGKINKSKAYYELGLKMLDTESTDYEDDKEMYRRLKEHIESENWKDGL
jgi:hypothetical protein